MAGRLKVGILISGRGSNMEALVRAAAAPDYPAEIAVVVSNRPDAVGLATARSWGLPAIAVDHKSFPAKASFEAAMTVVLEDHGVELVALAGFMRLLSPVFIAHWHNRLINIHPSLLPAYRGLDTHARAIADGCRLAGCSVHYVRIDVDTGPIVAQAAVPVLPEDDPDRLAVRVLAAEHVLYPHALALIARGAVTVDGDRLAHRADAGFDPGALLVTPALRPAS